MPYKASLRNEGSTSSGEIERCSEWRGPIRQHETSRFANEKPVSQRASQGLKSKGKVVKVESSIRPPHSDVPFEIVKNADNRFIVQTKASGSQHRDHVLKGVSKEDELVKYMSKVPSYLQRGEKLQDNVLNFGVLDWGRLEQWTHKRENVVAPNISNAISNSIPKVDFSPVVMPLSGKAMVDGDLQTSVSNFVDEKETSKKDTRRRRDSGKIRPSRCKEKYFSHDSSNCDGEVSRTLDNSNGEVLNCAQVFEELKLDTCDDQCCSGKQEGERVVLLLPKDFSGSGSSKARHRESLDGKAAEYNWGSFSDIFSIGEIDPEESLSDIPHSCPLNSALELETELDMKLDTLVKSQGVEIPVNPSDMPLHNVESKEELESSNSNVPKASMARNVQRFSDEILRDSSIHRRISSSLSRMTRSLSFRESSGQPPLTSTHVSAKSGPAKPEDSSTNGESRNSNNGYIHGRAKVSPLRRLLDPIFKSKDADQLGERSNDLIVKPVPIPMNDEHEPSTIKALLYLAVKSGLPLFKFVVGRNDEIFASTVKSLSTVGKDDMSWLYTFYSVQKIRKHSSSWKRNHQKVKPCELGYNVVGQMKVSKPHFPSWCEQKSKGTHMVKESVLHNVEISEENGMSSEFKTSRELAAVVVNLPDASGECSSFYADNNLNDCFSDSEHSKLGHIVVILPGGDHSLPHDGVPSSLITRWRNGGLCDCGGWDIGCKLRILTDKCQQLKYQVQCDLYEQGEAKQYSPLFSLIPLRDGLFSVEYDAQISSLQAFSISVSLINSHTPAPSYAMDQVESKQELGSANASMAIKNEGPENYARRPPLSPVGRV